MKFLVVFVALFALAVAAPAQSDDVQVLRQESNVGIDNFQTSLELDNGINQQAEGQLKQISSEESAIVVKGSFKWVDPSGQEHVITYIADENGYQPQGADIPVAPVA
ncbi:PREDICTED: larval cuticle protein 8-like [Drosophila arizonae]|uniref:Larval cuticle protein 8-like n=1 Tax=Drosophila arizonae TaxID=7263 RepID=A0ABM1P047_DROAR|nr:PREDICTED: larval cuticle protein 8-like [Drosophila arizonae]